MTVKMRTHVKEVFVKAKDSCVLLQLLCRVQLLRPHDYSTPAEMLFIHSTDIYQEPIICQILCYVMDMDL